MQLAFRLTLTGAMFLLAACGQAPASQRGSASAGSDDTVIARVGDRVITLGEIDEKAIQSNMAAFQQLYDARRQAVEEIVADALISQEAEAQGISKDELFAKEVAANVVAVGESDVEQFFNENRARLGGQSLEQIGPQIKQYLELNSQNAARQALLNKLRAKSGVNVALEPPRIPLQVASNERIKGKEDAAVTIIEYSDFQ